MAYPDPPTTPQIPQRGDRATFSNRVDAFLVWVAAIIPWLQGFVADFLATLTTLAAGGANSFSYRFSSTTTDGDPGAGLLRLNSATQNAATVLRIDPLAQNNVDVSAAINDVIASTSSIKGSVRLQKVNDPTAWLLFDITGAAAATGYYNLTLAPRAASSASPFPAGANLVVFFDRNGDRGESGATAYSKFSDKKPAGTSGGASIVGTNDRVLNTTEAGGITGASLTNNQFTLPAGTFDIFARAPSYLGGSHCAFVFNVTDNAPVLFGSSAYAGSSGQPDAAQTDSIVSGVVTLTSPKVFKLSHRIGTSGGGTLALGLAVGNAATVPLETYSEVIVRKIA